jgi:hypothetical protein
MLEYEIRIKWGIGGNFASCYLQNSKARRDEWTNVSGALLSRFFTMDLEGSPEDVVMAIREGEASFKGGTTANLDELRTYVGLCLEDIEFRYLHFLNCLNLDGNWPKAAKFGALWARPSGLTFATWSL